MRLCLSCFLAAALLAQTASAVMIVPLRAPATPIVPAAPLALGGASLSPGMSPLLTASPLAAGPSLPGIQSVAPDILPPKLPEVDLGEVVAAKQAVWVRRDHPNGPARWERGVIFSKSREGQKTFAKVRSWRIERGRWVFADRSILLDGDWQRELQTRGEEDEFMPHQFVEEAPRSRVLLEPGARVWFRVRSNLLYRGAVLGPAQDQGRPALKIRIWGFSPKNGHFEALDAVVPIDGYWADRISPRPEKDERIPDPGDVEAPPSQPLLKPGDPVWLQARGESGVCEWHRGILDALDETHGRASVTFWDNGSSFGRWDQRSVQLIPTWGDLMTPRSEETRGRRQPSRRR